MSQTNFYIRRNDSVRDLQLRFSLQFPYLKINFFRNRIGEKKISDHSAACSPDSKVKDLNTDLNDVEFEVNDNMTVSELENKFHEQFGLFVQVSRKSGNLWMEPTMTIGWTIKTQNEHGRDISGEDGEPLLFKDVPFGC